MAKTTSKTAQTRYRQHKVWETLELKLEALIAARYGDAKMEAWRTDIVDWLTEAKDREMEARQAKLEELNAEVERAKSRPESYREEADQLTTKLNDLWQEIDVQAKNIKLVSEGAQDRINKVWDQALSTWNQEHEQKDAEFQSEAAYRLGALAATANHGRAHS